MIFHEYWREWHSGAIYTWAFITHLFSALWSIISFTVTANHCGKKTYYCVDLISDFEREFVKEIMVIHQNNNSSPTMSYDFFNLGFLIYSTIHEFLLVKPVSNLMKSDWLPPLQTCHYYSQEHILPTSLQCCALHDSWVRPFSCFHSSFWCSEG